MSNVLQIVSALQHQQLLYVSLKIFVDADRIQNALLLPLIAIFPSKNVLLAYHHQIAQHLLFQYVFQTATYVDVTLMQNVQPQHLTARLGYRNALNV